MPVVIGYIPNDYGEAALEAGIEEARRRDTGVVVVNATRGDAYVDKKWVGESAHEELEARLDELELSHEVRQVTGEISSSLLEVAAEVAADVIVIGLRHRTPVGKMIMGSVAQQVLMDAVCPVLAVKPERLRT